MTRHVKKQENSTHKEKNNSSMACDPDPTQRLESAERFESSFHNCILYLQNVRHEDIITSQIELLRVKNDNVWDEKCTEWEAQQIRWGWRKDHWTWRRSNKMKWNYPKWNAEKKEAQEERKSTREWYGNSKQPNIWIIGVQRKGGREQKKYWKK